MVQQDSSGYNAQPWLSVPRRFRQGTAAKAASASVKNAIRCGSKKGWVRGCTFRGPQATGEVLEVRPRGVGMDERGGDSDAAWVRAGGEAWVVSAGVGGDGAATAGEVITACEWIGHGLATRGLRAVQTGRFHRLDGTGP